MPNDNISTPNERFINVPEYIWQFILVLDQPGFGLKDVIDGTVSAEAIAVMMPNYKYSDAMSTQPITLPTGQVVEIHSSDDWKNWETWRVNGNDLETVTGLDFLSNLPESLQDDIEEAGISSSLTAPLLVKAETALSTIKIPNTTIRHNGVTENSAISIYIPTNTCQVSPDENTISQGNVFYPSSAQGSPSKINTMEIRFHDDNIIQISSVENSSTSNGFREASPTQVGINEDSVINFSPTQVGFFEVSPSEIGFFEISSTEIGVSEISPTQISVPEIRSTEVSVSEISPTQISVPEISPNQSDLTKISFSSSISSEQFFSSHNSSPQIINSINFSTTNIWSKVLQQESAFDINFQITNLPTGQLAEAQITDFDTNGNPIGGTILIDDDANGKGWYIDPNPQDNSEYAYSLADWAYQATPDSPAYGKYDLLTTILHETAHLFGFIDGFWAFDKRTQTLDGTRYLIGEDFSATLDGEHLDKEAHPYDLLNTHLAPGMRKLPSDLDVKILQLLLAEESKSVGTSLVDAETPSAPLTSAPLVGIANSDFSIDDPNNPLFGWNTRGKTQILNQQAVLSENSPLQSKFSQTFTIPENAKTLQFTLINSQLGTDFLPDAVEVALLDANTNISLVDTIDGLTNTDAFINLQDNGMPYFGDNVNLPGAQSSGTPINPNTPRTIQLDLSHLTPGQVATLSFDLLGLGAKDAEVTIDNVIIFTNDSIAPTANNDTASTTSTQPVIINVINNDSDTDGSIDPTTLQLATSPSNGSVIINNDGTFTYTPNPDFAGTDSFTYTIADNTGALSNEATVSIEVINPKPTITNISYTSDIAEGQPATFTATATDTDSNILTYSWDFGDGQQKLGNEVSHTFPNSGTYPVTITVTDSDGNVGTETFNVEIANLAPVVEIGDPITTTEGQTVNFNGQFSDAGTDTHTITWDFGDNTTASDTFTPTHFYTQKGTYNVTLTVIDSDGASSSDSLEITVLNAAPTIGDISVNSNINEGETTTFSVTATDFNDENLTYTWNFSDGIVLQGQQIDRSFTSNGTYIATVTVDYTTANGTATAGVDYIATYGGLNIPANVTLNHYFVWLDRSEG